MPTDLPLQRPAVTAGSLRAWILAMRPATLSAAAVPVAVGTAVAAWMGGFRAGPAFAALAGALLLQVGANFANDVFDYEKGADTAERLGPTRAVQAGLLTPKAVRRGMFVVFALALLVGLYLMLVAGPAIFAVGVISILAAIAYTGGPYPLGYHGLGDVFVFVFFGFVAVAGTTYVQTGDLPALSLWAAVPVGSLATAILVVNNVRDAETDAKAGKRTLAVRFGRSAGIVEYGVLMAAAYGVPVGLALSDLGWPLLLPLLSAPLAVRLSMRLRTQRAAALNPVLVGTAKLLLIHGVLFAAAIVLAAAGSRP